VSVEELAHFQILLLEVSFRGRFELFVDFMIPFHWSDASVPCFI